MNLFQKLNLRFQTWKQGKEGKTIEFETFDRGNLEKVWDEIHEAEAKEPEAKEPEQLLTVDMVKAATKQLKELDRKYGAPESIEELKQIPGADKGAQAVGEIEFIEKYGSDHSYYTDINKLMRDALNCSDMGRTINVTLYRTPGAFIPGSWLEMLDPIKCNYQVIDNPFYVEE